MLKKIIGQFVLIFTQVNTQWSPTTSTLKFLFTYFLLSTMLTTQNLHFPMKMAQISWHTCLERALCCGCVNSFSLCSVLMCSCEAAAHRARDLYFLSKVEVGFTLTAPTFHWKSLELKTKFLSLWHGHLLQFFIQFFFLSCEYSITN